MLALVAVLSFRSVPRALVQFQPFAALPMQPPHFTSVINWTLRVGLARLKAIAPLAEPWIALIDVSIDVGIQKAFVILRVPFSTLEKTGAALNLASCECIGCVVRDSWNGESISVALAETFKKSGPPKAILRDGGSDLRKGIVLWKKRNKLGRVAVLSDVGHEAACALKARFSRVGGFRRAMTAVSVAAKKLGQSDISFLTPPKLRTKGRFLGITKLAHWARQALDLIGGSGRLPAGSVGARLRILLPKFGIHRPFLEKFCATCKVTEEFLTLFKTKGMNRETAAQGRLILKRLPYTCLVRCRMTRWIEKNLAAHCSLAVGQRPFQVSTDALESLFGKFKTIIQRSPKADFNRTVLIIPALCGRIDDAAVDAALRQVSHKDLKEWQETNVAQTQVQKRRSFLAKVPGPDPGKAHPA